MNLSRPVGMRHPRVGKEAQEMANADELRRTQIGENLRFYADMRFKQLTLLMTATTLLAAGVAQYGANPLFGSLTIGGVLSGAGMLITGAFWVMEVRSTLYWVAHREAAKELWPTPTSAKWRFLNATNVVLVVHMAFYAFWFWCAWEWYLRRWAVCSFAAIGLLLTVFTVLNYVQLWRHRE